MAEPEKIYTFENAVLFHTDEGDFMMIPFGKKFRVFQVWEKEEKPSRTWGAIELGKHPWSRD